MTFTKMLGPDELRRLDFRLHRREGHTLGLQSGSLSLCRYRLIGAGKRVSLGKLNELQAPHRASRVKLEGVTREESVGWVRPLGLDQLNLPPDAPWDMSHSQLEDGFVLRMRLERRKVPAQLMQLVLRQRLFAHEEKHGRPPGPKERRDLRERLKLELTGRALPILSHVDAFWRDKAGELWLFSTSNKVADLFEKLFRETFADPLEMNMVRLEPALLGLGSDAWSNAQGAVEALSRLAGAAPVSFAEMPPDFAETPMS